MSVHRKIKAKGNYITFLSKGAILDPDTQGLAPVKPDICQKPPSGGVTEPTTWPSNLNVIPVGSHSRPYV